MPVDELQDPVNYAWWWTPLGLLVMLAVVVWIVWVWTGPRRAARALAREPEAEPEGPAIHARPDDRWATVRPIYLERVDEVERRYTAGELDNRGLHLELSAVVRDFATVRREVDARTMTLAEIRELSGTKRLAKLIDSYYNPAFSRRGQYSASPKGALQGARRVIRQW